MVIAMLNGSPKVSSSNSEMNLSILEEKLRKNHTIKKYTIHKQLLSEKEVKELISSDILIIGFPLYIDGLPSHLLEQLMILEKAYQLIPNSQTMVYAVANNGFFEGDQNEYALEMIRNFCSRAGISWGQGMGIGAGEMQGQLIAEKTPVGKGPLTNYGKVVEAFITHIENRMGGDNLYFSPNFSAFLFKHMAHHYQWNGKAKKNGISKKQLGKKMVYHG